MRSLAGQPELSLEAQQVLPFVELAVVEVLAADGNFVAAASWDFVFALDLVCFG